MSIIHIIVQGFFVKSIHKISLHPSYVLVVMHVGILTFLWLHVDSRHSWWCWSNGQDKVSLNLEGHRTWRKPLPPQVTSEEAKNRRTTYFYVSFGHCRKDGRIGQRTRNVCVHASNNGGHAKRGNPRRNSTHTCLRKSDVYSNAIGLKNPKALWKTIHITIYSSFLFLIFSFSFLSNRFQVYDFTKDRPTGERSLHSSLFMLLVNTRLVLTLTVCDVASTPIYVCLKGYNNQSKTRSLFQ